MKLLNTLVLPLAFIFALTSCGEKNDPQPTAAKDVKIVITGTAHGSALSTNQTGAYTSTLGANSHFEVAQKDRTDGYNDELNSTNRPTVSYDFPKLATGTVINIEVGFNRLSSPPQGSTAMVGEIFVDGVSVKRVVCNSTTPGHNPSTRTIVATGSYTL